MSRGSVIVEADGGSRGNPGPAAYGAVLRDAVSGEVLAEDGTAIGIASNNVAEYSGLIAGLAKAVELGLEEVEVRSDSELMVKQMRGEYRVKNEGLQELHAQARKLAGHFDAIEYRHVRRAENELADKLVNQVLDAAQ